MKIDNILINKIYFVLIIIFSSRATEFYTSQIGGIVIVVLNIMVMYINKVNLRKELFYALGIWLLYCTMVFIRNDTLTPYFYYRYASYILISYTLIELYKYNIYIIYEKTITYLALISLIFYVILIISPTSIIKIISLLDVSGDMKRSSDMYYNMILYTVEIYDGKISLRNYGFVFEPGAYSIFLMLAIHINLMRNGNKIHSNKGLWVLILSLITTFSTTGYLAFGALSIYIAIKNNDYIKRYIITTMLIILFIYAFYKIEFLYYKIVELFIVSQNINEIMYNAAYAGETYSAGRFAGLYIGWQDIKQFPLLGRGGITELSFGRTNLISLNIVNGIANIMSQFGSFGLITYLYAILKSSKELSEKFISSNKYGLVIIILIGSFSFSVHYHIIMFTIIFSDILSENSNDEIKTLAIKINKNNNNDSY